MKATLARLTAATLLAFALGSMVGCEDDDGAIENAGEKIQDAADDAGDAMKDAAD